MHTYQIVSKRVVDMHHGKIFCSSEGEGKGCVFTVDIPITDNVTNYAMGGSDAGSWSCSSSMDESIGIVCDLSQEHHFEPRSPSCCDMDFSVRESQTRGIIQMSCEVKSNEVKSRILVVDDAVSNRRMHCRLLRNKYDVEEADDGDVAARKVLDRMETARNMFDAILIDNLMPNMVGPEATKILREKGYAGVVIGVTGNALDEDVRHFMSCGADAVLSKPVDPNNLETTIEALLNDK